MARSVHKLAIFFLPTHRLTPRCCGRPTKHLALLTAGNYVASELTMSLVSHQPLNVIRLDSGMITYDFKQATEAFGDFLVSQGWSRSISWVFREALTQYRRRWLIDVNATESGMLAADAECLYEAGRLRGLGIRLDAIGEASGTTYAYVWVPRDVSDAEAAMMTGELRFSITSSGAIIALTQRRRWFNVVRFLDGLRGGGTLLRVVPPRQRGAFVSALEATQLGYPHNPNRAGLGPNVFNPRD